jgi:hypothetical protein
VGGGLEAQSGAGAPIVERFARPRLRRVEGLLTTNIEFDEVHVDWADSLRYRPVALGQAIRKTHAEER